MTSQFKIGDEVILKRGTFVVGSGPSRAEGVVGRIVDIPFEDEEGPTFEVEFGIDLSNRPGMSRETTTLELTPADISPA